MSEPNPANQLCPLCDAPVHPSPRYPRYICSACLDLITDEEGRRVEFYNTDLSGGLEGRYRADKKIYRHEHCLVRGVRCHVQEHRFGGVVYQPRSDEVPPLQVLEGDITRLKVDAIVNPTNEALAGSGGLDRAIHEAAGPELDEACRRLGGCKVGEAKLTSGYRLPAAHVIHIVGPLWQGGGSGEASQLARCYERSLSLAVENGVRSLAFPMISTGAHGFPIPDAARIAVETVRTFICQHEKLKRIYFCCFDSRATTAIILRLAAAQPV